MDQDLVPHVTKKVVYNFKVPEAKTSEQKTAEVQVNPTELPLDSFVASNQRFFKLISHRKKKKGHVSSHGNLREALRVQEVRSELALSANKHRRAILMSS